MSITLIFNSNHCHVHTKTLCKNNNYMLQHKLNKTAKISIKKNMYIFKCFLFALPVHSQTL